MTPGFPRKFSGELFSEDEVDTLADHAHRETCVDHKPCVVSPWRLLDEDCEDEQADDDDVREAAFKDVDQNDSKGSYFVESVDDYPEQQR